MKRLAGYPQWFFAVFMLVLTLLLASGIALLPSMLEMRLDIDAPVRISGTARVISAAAHCVTGFLLAGIVGSLLAIHVRIGWRRRLNKISGVVLLVLSIALLVSAVGIYYVGDDGWSRNSSVIHSVAGLLATIVFAWHALKGARLRRADAIGELRGS